MSKIKTVPRSTIRALLFKQNGRCALSGVKINPATVAIDHIIPISRRDLIKKRDMAKDG